MNEKSCPYLREEGEKPLCMTSSIRMSPNSLNFTQYCTTEEHYRCPLLLAHTLMNGCRKSVARAGATRSW